MDSSDLDYFYNSNVRDHVNRIEDYTSNIPRMMKVINNTVLDSIDVIINNQDIINKNVCAIDIDGALDNIYDNICDIKGCQDTIDENMKSMINNDLKEIHDTITNIKENQSVILSAINDIKNNMSK